MKTLLVLIHFATMLFAVGDMQTLPGKDYRQQVGIANESNVSGSNLKRDIGKLPPRVQIPESKAPVEQVRGVDFTNAIILNQINEKNKGDGQNMQNSSSSDLMALPQTYKADIEKYNKSISAKNNATSVSKNTKEKIERLFFMQCRTPQDYKINTDTVLKMFCKDSKSDKAYRVNASIAVKNNEMLTIPYLIEDENGKVYSVNKDKSKLFNATNGSTNLATFVDKRALDKAEKGAINAFATQAPALAKDYIDQKNKADTELVQTNNGLNSTVTQSTTNPEPKASDYGITLALSMISEGMKGAIDQLYLDLGYIYFIPQDTVIEAELVVEVGEK